MKRRLAIIAGAGPGMGLAIARRFARGGFDVALIARDAGRLAESAAEFEGLGARASVHAADLSDLAAAEGAIHAIRAARGPAAVLAYNGGAWNQGAPLSMTAEAFHRDLGLCVSGAYACTRAVHADMAAGGGTVLFTGGGLALAPGAGVGVASLVAGKSGLRGLALVLHEELKPQGIHVGLVTIAGVVAPGTAFDPDRIAKAYWDMHIAPRGAWTAETVFRGA
ncbi:SDR family NAD(P)-dependent oxidoreductase [Falsiroseomonas oryzae]|uniref:SDR family NAD(P)-dependent oxidoreductase n=1 Tax=Falsiroseomonas oryzae TaxID=2766473 RepID=UPI0022EB19A6|nr:SDR family NAD(P)-dependent oxidoreductase [Roseomonas sp. MO-31]